MGQIYNSIKKKLESSNYNPDLDTLTISLEKNGIAYLGEMPWHKRIFNNILENRSRTINPPFTMQGAIIYRDTNPTLKYFDIETPLEKVGGVWKRYQPLVGYIDLRDSGQE